MSDDVRARIEATRGLVQHSDLAAHVSRDAVLVVSAELDLVDCGLAIAGNDVARIETWIGASTLRKPTADELALWGTDEGRRWVAVVVQPYVLVQDPND